jgi:hypothetical protein
MESGSNGVVFRSNGRVFGLNQGGIEIDYPINWKIPKLIRSEKVN